MPSEAMTAIIKAKEQLAKEFRELIEKSETERKFAEQQRLDLFGAVYYQTRTYWLTLFLKELEDLER